MSSDELKPCPFCGGDEHDVYDDHVRCVSCEARGPNRFACPNADWIAAWNKRAMSPEFVESVLKLEQLQKIQEQTRVRRYPDEVPEAYQAILLLTTSGWECAFYKHREWILPSGEKPVRGGDLWLPMPPSPEGE